MSVQASNTAVEVLTPPDDPIDWDTPPLEWALAGVRAAAEKLYAAIPERIKAEHERRNSPKSLAMVVCEIAADHRNMMINHPEYIEEELRHSLGKKLRQLELHNCGPQFPMEDVPAK